MKRFGLSRHDRDQQMRTSRALDPSVLGEVLKEHQQEEITRMAHQILPYLIRVARRAAQRQAPLNLPKLRIAFKAMQSSELALLVEHLPEDGPTGVPWDQKVAIMTALATVESIPLDRLLSNDNLARVWALLLELADAQETILHAFVLEGAGELEEPAPEASTPVE